METILLKSVRIIDTDGPHHNSVCDVLIQSGKIAEVSEQIKPPTDAHIWEQQGSAISTSWIDGQADFCDPGIETNEGLESGLQAALHAGLGHVILNTGTTPAPDHKSAIRYLVERSAASICLTHPLGCISQSRTGDRLAELHDLSESGAVGFSDDKPIDRTEMLRRALEYSESINLPVITCPLDEGLNSETMMHEGPASTAMGVAGNPSSAEVIRVQRDLEILRYAGGRLHFSVISSAKSVDLIRAAKKEGLQVTCGTTAHHLLFVDDDLMTFDGTLRVSPPFRSDADRMALCQGIADGTIDALVSDHRPQDLECSDVEFALSQPGIAGIESLFAAGFSALSMQFTTGEALAAIIRSLTVGPRAVFGWDAAAIAVGQPADITWFHEDLTWKSAHASKGTNTLEADQLIGKLNDEGALKGQPLGVITPRGAFRQPE